MRKTLVLALLLVFAALATAVATAEPAKNTVRIVGTEDFVPNVRIFNTWRFQPGPATVKSGDSLTWLEQTGAPHTVTLVHPGEVPASSEDLFAPCATCDAAFAGHFPLGFDDNDEPIEVVPVLETGGPGLDGVGDSLIVFGPVTGDAVSAQVTAPAGSTFSYICIFHPWMQGTIRVS